MRGGAKDVMGHPWFAGVDWRSLERKEIGAPIVPRVASMGVYFPLCMTVFLIDFMRSNRRFAEFPAVSTSPTARPSGCIRPNIQHIERSMWRTIYRLQFP